MEKDTEPFVRVEKMEIGLEARQLIRQLGKIIGGEREKKKMAMATGNELETIKDRLGEILDELVDENRGTMGRLEENRRQLEGVMRILGERTKGDNGGTSGKEDKGGREQAKGEGDKGRKEKGTADSRITVTDKGRKIRGDRTSDNGKTSENNMGTGIRTGGEGNSVRRWETVKERKKGVRSIDSTETETRKYGERKEDRKETRKENELDGGNGGFTLVKGRKKADWGGEKGFMGMSRRTLKSWKETEPPISFVVRSGEEGAAATKKGLWSEIVRKVGVPRVDKTWVDSKGDVRIVPGDKRTTEALRTLQGGEGGVKVIEVGVNWPKVWIQNMEKDLEKEEIAGSIGMLNPELGLVKGEERKAIIPIFIKGPRDWARTGWVCAVDPGVHAKMVGRNIYVGMAKCWVKEYIDFVQCRGCLGFGHVEARCKKGRILCAYCAGEGHRDRECPNKEGKPKCFNCGRESMAWHENCQIRMSEFRKMVQGTGYAARQ